MSSRGVLTSRVIWASAGLAVALLVAPTLYRVAEFAAEAPSFPEDPQRTPDRELVLEFSRGAAEARADLARGRLIIKGLRPTYSDFASLVLSRYGVTLEEFPSCGLGFSTAYARGYNSVSRPEIRRRVGTDTFPDCWYEAQEKVRAGAARRAPA